VVGLRFTKAEREYLGQRLATSAASKTEERLRQSILDKLEKSELVKGKGRAPGIGWFAAAAAMRTVLGPSLATPPSPDVGWIMKMSNRIRELGLTADDCARIAQALKARGRAPFSFEKAIWEADRLLAAPATTPQASSAPTEMEDL
jgi:hypothetical protein